MHELLQLDTALFLKIHRGLSNDFFDVLMPILRNRFFWTPLYLFIIIYCIRTYKKIGIYMIGGALLTFALGDLTASRIIKPNVNRTRPCNEVSLTSEIIHRVPCGSGQSFPSAHATNHFAIAVYFILLFYKRWKAILPIGIAWAAAISFAQIYVGVHYPIDVLCGAILGVGIGFLGAFIYQKIKPVQ
jgi:undecaprenyl-diphosphatase